MRFRLFLPALTLFLCTAAHAGPYADKFTHCFLTHLSGEEAQLLEQWAFGGLASNPVVQSMSRVTPQQADDLNRRMTLLLSDVTNNRCLKEYQDANRVEGKEATSESFGAIMQQAIDALGAGPEVARYFSGMDKYRHLLKVPPLK